MAKALDALYEAGNRGRSWLKLKPVYTLDLVVLAADWGHGWRQGWLRNLHLGARDPQDGQCVMLGRTFKGMGDDMLAWRTWPGSDVSARTNRSPMLTILTPCARCTPQSPAAAGCQAKAVEKVERGSLCRGTRTRWLAQFLHKNCHLRC